MLTIKQIISKYTITQPRKQSTKAKVPWLNEQIWTLMKKSDSALKKAIKTGLNTDRNIFKSLRNKVTIQLRKAKADFYLEIIKAAKGNTRQLWKSIDKIIGRGQTKKETIILKVNGTFISDNFEIGNHFNINFIQSVKLLNKKFSQALSNETILNTSLESRNNK